MQAWKSGRLCLCLGLLPTFDSETGVVLIWSCSEIWTERVSVEPVADGPLWIKKIKQPLFGLVASPWTQTTIGRLTGSVSSQSVSTPINPKYVPPHPHKCFPRYVRAQDSHTLNSLTAPRPPCTPKTPNQIKPAIAPKYGVDRSSCLSRCEHEDDAPGAATATPPCHLDVICRGGTRCIRDRKSSTGRLPNGVRRAKSCFRFCISLTHVFTVRSIPPKRNPSSPSHPLPPLPCHLGTELAALVQAALTFPVSAGWPPSHIVIITTVFMEASHRASSVRVESAHHHSCVEPPPFKPDHNRICGGGDNRQEVMSHYHPSPCTVPLQWTPRAICRTDIPRV